MALLPDKDPVERNKTILAIVLGVIAIIAVGYLIVGSSGSSPKPANANLKAKTTTAAPPGPAMPTVTKVRGGPEVPPQPINPNFQEPPSTEVGRNIFGYYEKPIVPVEVKPSPTPSPTPPPPLILAGVSPQTVFARTADFKLDVTGDKFVPGAQIYLNDNQIPTQFVSRQQLSAKVPAAMIAGEGPRTVIVRTTDGKLFSNSATLIVQAPPIPNFNFIGIFRTQRNVDTAILEDKGTKSQVSVQRGDVVGGRFRVTSTSPREIVLTDTSLRIKHTISMTGDTGQSAPYPNAPNVPRPPSPEDGGDDEGTAPP
jgi:hypothetical protein